MFWQNMTLAVIASVETVLEKWKGQEGKEIEVFGEFRLLTSEVISRTALGSNYLEGEEIFAMLNKLSILLNRNAFMTRIPFINKYWKTADLIESDKLEKGIQECVMNIVRKIEDRVVNGEADNFGNDFLGLLVSAYRDSDEKNRLSLEDLMGECKTFYFAGQETVTSLLAWVVFLLAVHKRFAEGIAKATKYNAAAYLLGPRSCIGMTFATTETKIALSMILQRYSFNLSPAYVHSPTPVITLRPQHGIQIILESLHKYTEAKD
ncbi:hypothetical protein V6N11_065556 [Hibiscus sabdariffa]|uniref:Cytochrome P450 n=1 Tax=Hibiscus sabdariffa TaxID=183260 RepID=A0ABR2PHN2_9ROSI